MASRKVRISKPPTPKPPTKGGGGRMYAGGSPTFDESAGVSRGAGSVRGMKPPTKSGGKISDLVYRGPRALPATPKPAGVRKPRISKAGVPSAVGKMPRVPAGPKRKRTGAVKYGRGIL